MEELWISVRNSVSAEIMEELWIGIMEEWRPGG
jgi:hypothetical protein